MRKLWLFTVMTFVAFALGACAANDAPVTDALPALPKVDDIQTQNFGLVKCGYPDGAARRCLGLEYGDGFGHPWNHDERAWVRSLQGFLSKRGFKGASGRALGVDGYFGTKTLQAVYKAQKNYLTRVDGDVGTCTRSSLLLDGPFCLDFL